MGMVQAMPCGKLRMGAGPVTHHAIQAAIERGKAMEKMHVHVMQKALDAAKIEATARLYEWYDGEDRGCCGFAWVNVKPKHKGNTKEGKAERKVLRDMGFELDWTGKEFQFWNPSKLGVQNVDVKAKGASVAARILREHGFDAYAGSRLD